MPIDYKNYPSNWKTVIRPAILKRSGNCCEFCKVPNKAIVCRGQWPDDFGDMVDCWQDDDGNIFSAVDGSRLGESYCGDVWVNGKDVLVKIVLTIAHLDNDIKNSDYGNLKALCCKCHNKLDIKFRVANRKISRKKKSGLQELF